MVKLDFLCLINLKRKLSVPNSDHKQTTILFLAQKEISNFVFDFNDSLTGKGPLPLLVSFISMW